MLHAFIILVQISYIHTRQSHACNESFINVFDHLHVFRITCFYGGLCSINLVFYFLDRAIKCFYVNIAIWIRVHWRVLRSHEPTHVCNLVQSSLPSRRNSRRRHHAGGRILRLKILSFSWHWHFCEPKRYTEKSRKSHKQKSQPTPDTRRKRKVTQINVCIANKQMHDKHKDQLPLPQARWSKC